MKPHGLLIREHRLIERMIALIDRQLCKIGQTDRVDPEFVQTAADFISTYADRTHHGKEEGILFKELAAKQISPEHKKIMNELIEEHTLARKLTGALVTARALYVRGNGRALTDIVQTMKALTILYPEHIDKEEERFFYPCMEYFSKQEQDDMLQAFYDFDQKMIHEKYQKLMDEVEKADGLTTSFL